MLPTLTTADEAERFRWELHKSPESRASRAPQACFAESDIVARLESDQVAVLALECSLADIPSVLERIEARVAELNGREVPYAMSLSVGTALFEPPATIDLKAMMDNADQAMNEQKRLAKQRRTA